MRILIATETYPPDVNGAAYFAQRLARLMTQRGHRVHVVCPATAEGRGATTEAVTLHELPSRSVPRYPQVRVAQLAHARRGVRRAMSECKPDVIHVQNHFTVGRAAIAEARERSMPVVGTNHFLPTNVLVYSPTPPILDRLIESLLWWQLRSAYRQVTIATAPTPYAAELTARACRRGVEAVSCGVDECMFRPDVSPTAFRERYAIRANRTLLVVGRLDPEKHVGELVSALPFVRDRVDAHLVLVGRGQRRVPLEELARRKGVSEHITFCGFVPDHLMPAAYAAGDVYCHAGTAELQSISTLEAMASGKAIIAAEAGALPLLIADGVNGYLYPPGNVESLAERLCTVLQDDPLREQMGRASRESVLRHSAQRSAVEFEAIYTRATTAVDARTAHPARARVPGRPLRSLSVKSTGTLVASAALTVPVLVALLRPEPAREHTDVILSYLLAAVSAVLSVGTIANYSVTRAGALPGWLDLIAAKRVAVLLLGIALALAIALAALADRGTL